MGIADWWQRLRGGRRAQPARGGAGDDIEAAARALAQARGVEPLAGRGREDLTRLTALQRAYWTPAPDEQAELAARLAELAGAQLLRLHHLVCLDLLASPEVPPEDARALCAALARRLAAPDSPYRPRDAIVVWPGAGAATEPARHRRGRLQNASCSHVGALEVIRYAEDQPTTLDFIPFDDIKTVTLGRGSPFRAALIELEDVAAAPLTVRLATLYGPSWSQGDDALRDGSLTLFPVDLDDAQLALGAQDLALDTDGARTVIGLTSPAFLRFVR